ncbi:cobalt-precorrin-6A reductase [Nioella aestuarii]|uniref:cobalt-precorrin-6A reductase n=1 Tax=Nioella aestuarii TaxID=1662864 RepID=UPI003D7F4B85
MTRILLLGGTTEATMLARLLAEAGVDGIFSYAGRTDKPMAQPLPTRVGGFGGVVGLVDYLRAERITHVVDATHPFAAQMSTHAVAACTESGVALAGLERPGWPQGEGDRWTHVADMSGAVAALPSDGARVFLAIGKQNLADFAAKPANFYLLRLVDPPTDPLPLPNAEAVIARGPFDMASDRQLLEHHAITHIVAKNSGGSGARAKLDAARALGLPVILIDRPHVPPRRVLDRPEAVMAWLDHSADLGV